MLLLSGVVSFRGKVVFAIESPVKELSIVEFKPKASEKAKISDVALEKGLSVENLSRVEFKPKLSGTVEFASNSAVPKICDVVFVIESPVVSELSGSF